MSRFILYRPTPEDVAEAYARSQRLGVLPNSFTRGKGRMAGFLGEVAFERTFGGDYVGDESRTHDYEIKASSIDVKAKICSTVPQMTYCVSVPAQRLKPLQADVYFFTRVLNDYSKVWLLGWATAKSVQQDKFYKKKGEADDYGFTFLSSGYHLPINRTRRPDSFTNYLDKQSGRRSG